MMHSLAETESPGWVAALEQADETIWLTDDVPLMFRRIIGTETIPLPEFRMGSRGFYHYEEPIHLVRLTKPYYLSTFPITQQQWRVLIEQSAGTDFKADPSDFKGDLRPVENVSWHDAVAWCERLEHCEPFAALKHDYHAGLPSEAQWEYACRAGTETEFYTGDGEEALAEAGWYSGNAGGSKQTIGLLAANAFGLYDMHGNVWEWCRDAWDAHAYKHRIDGVCEPEELGGKDADRVKGNRTQWIARGWQSRPTDEF